MSSQQYRARPGGFLTDAQAKKYGQVLRQIEQTHGYVDKHLVLKEATNKRSPLHDAFEWDDTKAAQKHREHQAAQIITAIVWKVETEDQPLYVRSWNLVTVKDGKQKKNVYLNHRTVMNNEDMVAQVATDVFKNYLSWKRQYAYYKQWQDVAKRIVETEQKSLKKKAHA